MDANFFATMTAVWQLWSAYKEKGLGPNLITQAATLAKQSGMSIDDNIIKAAVAITNGDEQAAIAGINSLDDDWIRKIPVSLRNALISKLQQKVIDHG